MILLKGVRGGIQTGTEVETLEEHCSVDFSRVHSHLAFLYSQGQMCRDCTTHSGLGPPPSTLNQKNALRRHAHGQPRGGNSSAEVPSSRCVDSKD